MSQTRTQTLYRTVVNPTRDHDYLYDSNYTLSSDQDHARDAYRAQTNPNRIKRVPTHKEMFSALPHYPRFRYRLDMTDPVPKFVSRRWRGYAEQRREAIIRYKTCNYDPSVDIPPVKYEDAKVSGQNRYKYFRRPIIPFLQQVPPEVLLQQTTVDPLAPPGEILRRVPTPATRNIEIQTDYRDSEAQTDPYTPEYVVRPGSAPELLTLATLTYNHGLPAGLAEVEMIERARAKREWEKTLPPLSDLTQLEKRKRMMDEMETKEWLLREQEIEKLQEERLEVLKKLLVQREIKQQELNDKRLDKLWSKKQKIKEGKILKIRKDHIKTIRRLTRNCKNVEGKLERRDFVKEYGQFGSQVHAPLTRIGVFLDRGSEQYVVRSRYLNTFQGLLELEASLPDYVTQPRVRAPQKPLTGAFGYVKKKYRLTKQLEEMHKAITEAKKKGEEPPKPLRFLHKVEKPIPRPPTPTTEVPSEELEEKELATILLQKVIRGRAIQNMMYEGKEKRLELINEVRSTHALQKAEQLLKKAERQHVVTLQRQRRLYQHKESCVNEVVSQIEGESVGDLLDFLSKELIRLQEERRIHAISMLAERRRRLREAEESGRRQVEERRRREEDEIFKQLVKIHQTTVDTYLEDIIMDAVDGTADEQARNEIRELADKINDVAYEMEERRTLLQSEEIVSELVHCFLLPEVLKINSREKIKLDQKKHILAAHRIIHATTAPIWDESLDADARIPGSRDGQRAGDRPSSTRYDSSSSPRSDAKVSSPADQSSRKSRLAMRLLSDEARLSKEDEDMSQAVTSPDVPQRRSQPAVPTQRSSTSPAGRKSAIYSSPPLSRDLGGRGTDEGMPGTPASARSSGLVDELSRKGTPESHADHDSRGHDYLSRERTGEEIPADEGRLRLQRRSDVSVPTESLPTSPASRKSLPLSHRGSPILDSLAPIVLADTEQKDAELLEPDASPAESPTVRRTDPALPTQYLPTSTVSTKSLPPKHTPLSDVTHVDAPIPVPSPSPTRRTLPSLPSQLLDTAAASRKSDPSVHSDIKDDDVLDDVESPTSPSRRSQPPVPTQLMDSEQTSRKSDPEVRADVTEDVDQTATGPEQTAQISDPEMRADVTEDVDQTATGPEQTAQTSDPEMRADVTEDVDQTAIEPEQTAQTSDPEMRADVTEDLDQTATEPEQTAQTSDPEMRADVTEDVDQTAIEPEQTAQPSDPEVRADTTEDVDQTAIEPEQTAQASDLEVRADVTEDVDETATDPGLVLQSDGAVDSVETEEVETGSQQKEGPETE